MNTVRANTAASAVTRANAKRTAGYGLTVGALATALAIAAAAWPADAAAAAGTAAGTGAMANGSTAAVADPDVSDQGLRQSVHELPVGKAVHGIDLSSAVVPLEEESSSGGKVTIRISADVLFDFGKAGLTDVARDKIKDLATRLAGASGTVRVVGFTDSVGATTANLRLSRERADAVRAELAGHVEAVTIEATGRGEADPVAPNTEGGKDNPAGRAENRRVEIVFGEARPGG